MGKFIDLTGQQFGEWTVLHRVESLQSKSGNYITMYRCRCSCGVEKDVRAANLKAGNSNNCGHRLKNNLIGEKFGYWTVISECDDYVSPKGLSQTQWLCRCICGTEKIVIQTSLKSGSSTSCGCMSGLTMHKKSDITGKQFGKLTVVKRVDDYVSPKGARVPKWLCKCECGNELEVISTSLRNGDTKSCGCIGKIRTVSQVKRTNTKDFLGEHFGHLVVKDVVKETNSIKEAIFQCECECGNITQKSYNALRKNPNVSCGCIRKQPLNKVKPSNLIGKQLGDLIVIDELEPHITPNGSKQRIVKVRCSCGNIVDVRYSSAKETGKCRNCSAKEKRIDITGKSFGLLTVVSMAEDYVSPSGHRLSQCNCICKCGNTSIVAMSQLVTGSTRSCGCLKNTSGLLKDVPHLVKEYNFEKNNSLGIDFEKITARNNEIIWWKCEKGHEWEAQVASRNDIKHHGCPYCSGLLILEGVNDLLTIYPELCKEWNYEKNKGLTNKRIGDISTPNKISPNSSLSVWWKCKECGNEWKAQVSNRTNGSSGCPKCNIEKVNSFCEQSVYYYIKQAFPDAINSDKHIGMELDIYIPSINVAIEYDGEAWHESNKRIQSDTKKNQLCKELGITLIRIREPRLEEIDGCIIFKRLDSTNNDSLSVVILDVLEYLGITYIDVDVDRDNVFILEQYATKKYENSLLYCYPDIAKEWHPILNGKLTPDKVSKATSKKVWWLGKCGHEWKMAVSDRTTTFLRSNGHTKKQYGCPYCSGKRILLGFNDFESQHPELLSEWDYEKNTKSPKEFTQKSSKYVFWKCSTKGHSYKRNINSQVEKKGQCPECRRLPLEIH